MKLFFIFLHFLIYLGHTAGYNYPRNDETADAHLEMDNPNYSDLRKTEIDSKTIEPQLPRFAWPYVGDGCCNLSTTPKCWKGGGQCIPRNDTCDGDVYLGPKYCDFNKLKSCQCCVPINCESLNLCKVLNGTCNKTCEGRSVSGKDFCKDSKNCKCCLPEPQDCPCGQDHNGGCNGQFLSGQWTMGYCEKDCSNGTHPLGNHTCSKTGGEDCQCCARAITTTTTIATTITTTTTTPTPTTTYCDTQRTTICPDQSRCHSDARCIPYNSGFVRYYACKCKTGYAGDGADCGLDQDIDTWPEVDLTCCKVQSHCRADNCPAKPNSGQEDKDYDGIGDACDFDQDNYTGTTPPTTTPDPTLECQDIFDASKNIDTDGDGHMDFFDNCPNITNVNQTDTDGDSVGDLCDTDLDADNDGVQDGIDNCQYVVNPEQIDTDKDGLGDKCDTDADNDGILNTKDNCWQVPNSGQEDANKDGVGDACEDDKDGDGCIDFVDICPNNPKINSVDFGNFKNISLDPSGSIQPVWVLTNGGKEITQNENSVAAYMYGLHSFSGLDYEGTLFIGRIDNDNAGFIFGYQSKKKYYAVVWNKYHIFGLQLKKVNSNIAPTSLWNSASNSLVEVVWKEPNFTPWEYETSYRWQLIHRPHIGLIRFRFLTGSTVISDSGNIFDHDIVGGHVGVFCESQALITWSGIDYSCNDDSVPQEVYDSLPADKKSNMTVNPYKTWAGTIQLGNTTIIP